MLVSAALVVTSVGQQATAVFQTSTGNSTSVELVVWSGNAQIAIADSDPVDIETSRAAKLATDIAIAHDVLAHLPT